MTTYSPFRFRPTSTFLLLAGLLLAGFSACNKDNGNYVITPSGDIVEVEEEDTVQPATLIPICHYDAETNTYERMKVTEKEWGHYARYGDVRLDDQDKDGFIAFNHCDAAEGIYLFDCDDSDATRHPANAEQCDAVDRDCNGDPYNRVTKVFSAAGKAYTCATATFGPKVDAVTASWTAMPWMGSCEKYTGPEPVAGKIALIDPAASVGIASCPDTEDNFFARMALLAQQAGAVGVIFCHTDLTAPIGHANSGKDPVTVPVSAISQKDCVKLQAKGTGELSIQTRSVCGIPALPK